MPNVATLTIDLVARTASFDGPIKKSTQAAKDGARGIQDAFNGMNLSEARGTVGLLGEDIGLRLPRHLQTFLAELPGVAPVMASAFSAVAVVTLIEKVVEFIGKSAEYKETLAQQSRATFESATAVAEFAEKLQLTNLKLEDQIRVLQKLPTKNGIVIAMQDGIDKTNELIKVIDKAIQEESKLLESSKQGEFSKIFWGTSGSESMRAELAEALEERKQLVEDSRRAIAMTQAYGAIEEVKALQESVKKEESLYQAHLDQMKGDLRRAIQERASVIKSGDQRMPILGAPDWGDSLQQALMEFKEISGALETMRIDAIGVDAGFREIATNAKDQSILSALKNEKVAIVDLTREVEKRSKIQEMITKQQQESSRADGQADIALEKASDLFAEQAKKRLDALSRIAEKTEEERLKTIQATASQAEASIKEEAGLGILTKKQEAQRLINILKQAETSELDIITPKLQQQLALLQRLTQQTLGGLTGSADQTQQYGQALEAYRHYKEQQTQIEKQYNDEIASAQKDMQSKSISSLKEQLSQWKDIDQQMGQFYTSTLNGMNSQLESFLSTGKLNWRQFAAQTVDSIAMVAAKWIESHTIMAAINALFGSQQDAQQSTKIATTLAGNVLMAQSAAGLAAANALAAAALEDPFGAAAISAMVFAIGESYAADAAAQRGALLPNRDMLVHTHPKEMILPQHISNFIVDAASRGASGGSSGGNQQPPHLHMHLHFPEGFDGTSRDGRDLVEQMSRMGASQLKRAFRNLRR